LINFIRQFWGGVALVIVGHIAFAPIIYLFSKFGFIKKYYVIVYGIEVWKRLSFIQKKSLLGAEKIIAISEATSFQLNSSNDFIFNNIINIPLCVAEKLEPGSSSIKLVGGFKMLCVSRQIASEKYKGFESIFNAILTLKKYKNIHLNLVGDGDDHGRLINIVNSLGIGSQVTFWGSLPAVELEAAYKQCDLFIMPSKGEGFGIVFLEAMKHSKPCIGGNHGGTPEVIIHNNTGYLVDYDDHEQLSNYIQILMLDSNLRNEFGINGKLRVEEYFSISIFKNNYKKLLNIGL
jgi:glycosyltransferase involved in cell wall biosynthesis